MVVATHTAAGGITAVFLAHLMLAVCYGHVFFGEKQQPPSVWFFPALSAICSPLTLLSRSLQRCPLIVTIYLSAFETNFTQTCTASCVADSHSTACVFLQGLNSLTAGFSLALWYIYKQYRAGLVMAECRLLLFFP